MTDSKVNALFIGGPNNGTYSFVEPLFPHIDSMPSGIAFENGAYEKDKKLGDITVYKWNPNGITLKFIDDEEESA